MQLNQKNPEVENSDASTKLQSEASTAPGVYDDKIQISTARFKKFSFLWNCTLFYVRILLPFAHRRDVGPTFGVDNEQTTNRCRVNVRDFTLICRHRIDIRFNLERTSD
ncbi:Uncharacterised protein at_DN0323 [Pycnogonum litorale]